MTIRAHLIAASGIEAYRPRGNAFHDRLVIDLQWETADYQQTAGVWRPTPDPSRP